MGKDTTLVLGASENTERYSNRAIKSLLRHGQKVVAIGAKKGVVEGVEFSKDRPAFDDVDTITLYLSQRNQVDYYDYILSLNPRRIIYNPGAENPELEALAASKGIENLEACTLVLLGTGQY